MTSTLPSTLRFIAEVPGPSLESNWGCHLSLLSATLHLISSDLVPALLPTPKSHAGPQSLGNS